MGEERIYMHTYCRVPWGLPLPGRIAKQFPLEVYSRDSRRLWRAREGKGATMTEQTEAQRKAVYLKPTTNRQTEATEINTGFN